MFSEIVGIAHVDFGFEVGIFQFDCATQWEVLGYSEVGNLSMSVASDS